MATSRSRVHENFQRQVEHLAEQSKQLGESVAGKADRPWMFPAGGESLDVTDLQAMMDPFQRGEVNQNYEETLADAAKPGATADCIALKLQVDWLACYERAFRLRHSSSLRARAHSAARRKAHGHGAGVLLGGVLRYIQDLVKAGQTSPAK